MAPDIAHAREREQQLDDALAAYYEAIAAGQPVDREALLARHPELAAELTAFFAAEERMDRLMVPLRPAFGAKTANAIDDIFGQEHTVGDYELLDVLGQGGMGVVYKARQKSLNRLVALKMIRGDRLGLPGQAGRFRSEAEAVAALDHPNVVPIYEVGEWAGQRYFTMKLLEGGSVAQQLPRYLADQRGAVGLVLEIARAVQHAHDRGILHRDLKPSNILLDAASKPHVADFGLAKWTETDSSVTSTGILLGTPSYVAPEQTSGGLRPETAATDVYGLGAIMYVVLTGRPPFEGETPLDTLDQVRKDEPPGLRALNGSVGRDLETICLKCLVKDPQSRYPSARAVADELERYLRGEPIQAQRLSVVGRLARWCKQPERVHGAGFAMLVFAGAMMIYQVVGVLLVATGNTTMERPGDVLRANTGAMVCYYLPMLWWGFKTMKGRQFALWAGFLHCGFLFVVMTTAINVTILSFAEFGGAESETNFVLLIQTLIALWSGIITGVQAIGLVAYYANRGLFKKALRRAVAGRSAS